MQQKSLNIIDTDLENPLSTAHQVVQTNKQELNKSTFFTEH